MNKINYHKELEKLLPSASGKRLLLHSCCAPCSSYCLLYLLEHFDITCFYYNPNITDEDEYAKRLAELHRLVDAVNEEYSSHIDVIDGQYEPQRFLDQVHSSGFENCPEGGQRCRMCFGMRLSVAYETARNNGFDYFTTTLTISPLKDAQLINTIGYEISKASSDVAGPMWLPSDFKKNGGYQKSIELSRKYGLYRQNYCGCDMSRSQIVTGGAPFERVRQL